MSSPDHPTRVIGAAPGSSSRTWFMVADGGLATLCYPRIERTILDSLRFVAADTGDVDDEARHDVRWLEPGVPSFIIESRLRACSLTTNVVLDPDSNVLVLSGIFRPDQPDTRLRLRAEPHGPATSHVLDREPPALAACIGEAWVALIGPFDSCGVGAALTAELAVAGGAFEVALGFGDSLEAAEAAAHKALATGASVLAAATVRAWRSLPGPQRQVLRAAGVHGATTARCSMALLRCLEDKERPGAFAGAPGAGLSTRDGALIASALLDAGDARPAQRLFAYPAPTPEEGSDPVEVALPVLLAWRLRAVGALDHDPWPWLVRPAALWLINQAPSSQAETVAAMLAAAEFASDARELPAAEHLQVVADHWQAGVEDWELTPTGGSFAAHTEQLRTLAARGRPRLPDLLQPARQRYGRGRPARPALVWHQGHQPGELPYGRPLRVQVRRRGTMAWTADGWATSKVVEARNTSLGCWVADLDTSQVRVGASVEWTASYADGRWEPSCHRLAVLPP